MLGPGAERVEEARERQEFRLGPGRKNADMTEGELSVHATLDDNGSALLAEGHRDMGLSGRGWNRVLKVARTIADLERAEAISFEHVQEALALRRKSAR